MVFSRFLHWFFSKSEPVVPVTPHETEADRNHKLIYEEIRGYAAHQAAQMDSLDGKAGLVAATATALTGGFLALTNSADTTHRREFYLSINRYPFDFTLQMSPHTLHFLLYLAVFAGYALVFFHTYRATRLEDWLVVPSPTRLLDHYWDLDEAETLSRLAASLEVACRKNEPRLDYKKKWVGRSYVALGVQISILLGAILIGAWHNLL